MGKKIWALEKLQRILSTLFDDDDDDTKTQTSHGNRGMATQMRGAGKEVDLSQLLQKEKVNGPADRDMSVATQEMSQLRGYYIYVYDMDEKTRPVMVREYDAPKNTSGKWPQLRQNAPGKCPFIDDPSARKQPQQDQANGGPNPELSQTVVTRTRAASALETARQKLPTNESRRALVADSQFTRRAVNAGGITTASEFAKPLDPPKVIPAKRSNTADGATPMFTSTQARMRAAPRYAGGEPVASGVQPSNITSAIRSHIVSSISSTAAGPGGRAGHSKEVQQLKRRVLEKNSGPSVNSMPSSYINDIRAAVNQEHGPPPRAAKRKAQESLAGITEDMTLSEQETANRRLAALRRKKVIEKEAKPGYCENCREKFNDFDDVSFFDFASKGMFC
jgi:regulatory subunit for Cdc7p protein kinase